MLSVKERRGFTVRWAALPTHRRTRARRSGGSVRAPATASLFEWGLASSGVLPKRTRLGFEYPFSQSVGDFDDDDEGVGSDADGDIGAIMMGGAAEAQAVAAA